MPRDIADHLVQLHGTCSSTHISGQTHLILYVTQLQSACLCKMVTTTTVERTISPHPKYTNLGSRS